MTVVKDSIPWSAEEWQPPSSTSSAASYAVTEQVVRELRRKQELWYEQGSSVARFTQMLKKPPRSRKSNVNLTYDVTTAVPSAQAIAYLE